MEKNKPFWKSKTKTGSVILGISAILGTIGGWMTGSINPATAFQALVAEVGVVWLAMGLRDLPFVNKK